MVGECRIELLVGERMRRGPCGGEEIVEARVGAGLGDLCDPAADVEARLQELSCLLGGAALN